MQLSSSQIPSCLNLVNNVKFYIIDFGIAENLFLFIFLGQQLYICSNTTQWCKFKIYLTNIQKIGTNILTIKNWTLYVAYCWF